MTLYPLHIPGTLKGQDQVSRCQPHRSGSLSKSRCRDLICQLGTDCSLSSFRGTSLLRIPRTRFGEILQRTSCHCKIRTLWLRPRRCLLAPQDTQRNRLLPHWRRFQAHKFRMMCARYCFSCPRCTPHIESPLRRAGSVQLGSQRIPWQGCCRCRSVQLGTMSTRPGLSERTCLSRNPDSYRTGPVQRYTARPHSLDTLCARTRRLLQPHRRDRAFQAGTARTAPGSLAVHLLADPRVPDTQDSGSRR